AALPHPGRVRTRLRGHAAAVPHRPGEGRLLCPGRGRARRHPRAPDRRETPRQAAGHALQGPGRDEPAAAAGNHHGPEYPPPGAADPGRLRGHPAGDGHAACQEARQRPQELAGKQGQPGRGRGLIRLWLLAGLLLTGAVPVAATEQLQLAGEHPVDGVPRGNLSGLAWCGDGFWTVSDRDDDRLYRLVPGEQSWTVEEERFSAPPPPPSGLPW